MSIVYCIGVRRIVQGAERDAQTDAGHTDTFRTPQTPPHTRVGVGTLRWHAGFFLFLVCTAETIYRLCSSHAPTHV